MLKFSLSLIVGLFATYVDAQSIIDVDSYRGLASDRRAYRAGDPLVVLVVESTHAESSAGTGVSRDMAIRLSAQDSVNDVSAGLGIAAGNEGTGQTVRQGKARTQLSAKITRVVSVGLYEIEGEQNLVVNGEKQKIVLTGLVRSEDISKENTLMSNRIADASIEIDGVGDVSEAQRKGIIYKVFNWLGII